MELRLPEGSSIAATEKTAARFAECFDGHGQVANYSYYVGQGAPRFVLTADPVLPNPTYAQFVIVAKDLESRHVLEKKGEQLVGGTIPGSTRQCEVC